MKKIVFQIVLSVLCFSAQAQKISNIRAEQRGQEIVILYSLETTSPCEVSLLLSQDNGVTWGSPLKNVSGDVGKNISAGQKSITWKVLEEQDQLVGSKIKFKVISTGKKALALVDHEMVFVKGGTVQMGVNAGKTIVRPVRTESVGSFNIGKYEVTQAQWKAIMGTNPSAFRDCDQCPVEQVSWNDVQDFITKLNSQSKKSYRLPTEVEWEYAAKGGNISKGYSYAGAEEINSAAWFVGNSANKTNPVGLREPNELGLFDLSGNVYEWCSDLYGNIVADKGMMVGMVAAPTVPFRVLRGGSWVDLAKVCRTANRSGFDPAKGNNFSGFRLVLPVE
jgi:formylglycine-generating enzyme required for sulfatase activity